MGFLWRFLRGRRRNRHKDTKPLSHKGCFIIMLFLSQFILLFNLNSCQQRILPALSRPELSLPFSCKRLHVLPTASLQAMPSVLQGYTRLAARCTTVRLGFQFRLTGPLAASFPVCRQGRLSMKDRVCTK